MQDLLELPPRVFFKPASFKAGKNYFFDAFKNGFQNDQKSLSNNAYEKSSDSANSIRGYGEWNESFCSDKNKALENPYVLQPSEQRLRRISPTQAGKIQDREEIQRVNERYAAFGTKPLVRSGEQRGEFLPYPPMDHELLPSNHKGSYKDSKKLFVFLWVLIFLFIALGGLSIGLGLYYGLSGNPTSPNKLTLDFTVTNATFNDSLTDKGSYLYFQWKTSICDACTNLLKKLNSNESLVQSCPDISFRPGSIIVSLNLVVSSELNQSEAIRRLNASFPNKFLEGYECRFASTDKGKDGTQSTSAPQVSSATTRTPALEGTTLIQNTTTIPGDSTTLPSTTTERHTISTLIATTSTRITETTVTNPTTITSNNFTKMQETTHIILTSS